MIREAVKEDLHDLLKLYRQLHPDEDYSNAEQFSGTWNTILSDEKIKCFIAYEGTEPVSTCIITVVPNLTRNQMSYAVIENVVTGNNYRKKGYGKAVINEAVKTAKQNNCYKVMLLSGTGRKEAHRFYEKIGFEGNSKKGFQLRLG